MDIYYEHNIIIFSFIAPWKSNYIYFVQFGYLYFETLSCS